MISVEARLSRGDFTLDVAFSTRARGAAIFGRSGAGKTTLLHAIAGLVRPETGRIEAGDRTLFDSRRGIDLPPRRRGVGFVRQEPDLFPRMSVRENLAFARSCRSGRPGVSEEEAIEAFGIGSLAARLPRELSGGQARRVQMARAVVSAPRLLLLDEPLANLDDAARREILPFLTMLPHRFGLDTLLVTHRAEEVFAAASEVFVLEDGRVEASGEPYETLSRPAAWAVARLTGVENYLRATVLGPDEREGGTLASWGTLRLHVPRLDLPAGAAVTFGLFAEDVLLARGLSGGVSSRNLLDVEVEEITQGGGEALVRLRAGSERLTAKVTAGAVRDLALSPGERVTALVKSTALRLLE